MEKLKVVITQGHRWHYFQWFLLGFYRLQERGKIDFELKVPFVEKLPFFACGDFMMRVGRKIQFEHGKDSYHMDGYVEDEEGKKHSSYFG